MQKQMGGASLYASTFCPHCKQRLSQRFQSLADHIAARHPELATENNKENQDTVFSEEEKNNIDVNHTTKQATKTTKAGGAHKRPTPRKTKTASRRKTAEPATRRSRSTHSTKRPRLSSPVTTVEPITPLNQKYFPSASVPVALAMPTIPVPTFIDLSAKDSVIAGPDKQEEQEAPKCPICSCVFASTDQREINKHVDECLSGQYISEHKAELYYVSNDNNNARDEKSGAGPHIIRLPKVQDVEEEEEEEEEIAEMYEDEEEEETDLVKEGGMPIAHLTPSFTQQSTTQQKTDTNTNTPSNNNNNAFHIASQFMANRQRVVPITPSVPNNNFAWLPVFGSNSNNNNNNNNNMRDGWATAALKAAAQHEQKQNQQPHILGAENTAEEQQKRARDDVVILEKDLEDRECPICFEEFVKGASVVWLECVCLYHDDCIKSWYKKVGQRCCPLHRDSTIVST